MRRNFSIAVLTSIFLFSFILCLNADTLYLKNGRSIEGLIKAEDEQGVDLDVGFGTVRFSRGQIERIERASSGEADLIRQKWEEKKQKALDKEKEEQLKKELEPKQIDVQQQSGHVVVEVLINKKIKASLILDTGATYMVLTHAMAQKIDLDIDERIGKDIEMVLADGRKTKAKYMILDTVSAQGVEAKNVAAAVLPSDVADAKFKDGLLGMSFLKNFVFKVDQKNNKLVLEKAQ